MNRTEVMTLCDKIRNLKEGDFLYDVFNYRSLKLKSKQHAKDIAEDIEHNFALYNRVRYEIFDPGRHLKLNGKRSDNYFAE